MVSLVDSTRLLSSQLALQVLHGGEPSSDGLAGSDDSSFANGDFSSLPSQSRSALTALLNGLPANQTSDTGSSDSTLASTDITTSSFMALLKQNLTAAAEAKGGNSQEAAMLEAFNNGTLQVTDPTKGVTIKAWDVADEDQDLESKPGQTVETSDWNDFLRSHLERDNHGALVKTDDGSFVEKNTGNHVYFGQVGSQYYYLTWPAAADPKPAANAPASDAPPADAPETSKPDTGA